MSERMALFPVGHPDAQLLPVGLLAVCPLIAGSPTLAAAACIVPGFFLTLVLASVTMSLLGRRIPADDRVLVILVVSAVWVSVYDLVLQAAAYPLAQQTGPYVALLAGNSLVLAVGEQSLRGGDPKGSVRQAARHGLHAACWVFAVALTREVVGTGGIFNDNVSVAWLPGSIRFLPFSAPALSAPMWGFLVLALLAAAWAAVAARNRPAVMPR